jgi:para-aminobenzoate synthetase/4-amino-4-deoxychorismate lyase
MSSIHIAAAWHSGMTHVNGPQGLCVANGDPIELLTVRWQEDLIDQIKQAQAMANSGFYVVGGLSYEAASAFDPALKVCPLSDFPLLEFHVFDPKQISILPVDQIRGMTERSGFLPWRDLHNTSEYSDWFLQIKKAIEAGEFYQINITTRLETDCHQIDSWVLFQHLYLSQPAPQSLFLKGSVFDVLSLSPELFFHWDGTELKTEPMKGTRQAALDAFDQLKDSAKDRAENVMIVDLLRNDMAKVCKPRSVQVRSLFDVMHLPTVEQMTSSIIGQTLPNITLVDVFSALFPCGSVTGAPKTQAMLRIAQLEQVPRKFYCGALGVLSPGGCAHFNVPIRTVIAHNNQFEYGVGSGITWDSTLNAEKKEWWQKTAFLRKATTDFQVLETLRLDHGKWINLNDHLLRMTAAAHFFSYVYDQAAIIGVLEQVSSCHKDGVYRVRCLLHADGRLEVELHELELIKEQVYLRLASQAMQVAMPEFIRYKTTFRPEYDFFQQEAKGAFDVLLFNSNGDLTESCRFNVVLKINGELLTPSICENSKVYLLPGVLRARLLRENVLKTSRLTVKDLQRAEQVWLINSLRDWVPVAVVYDNHDSVLFSANSVSNKQ